MQCSFTIIRLIRTLDTIFSIFMRRLSIYCWNINCYHISIIYSLSYIGNGLEMQHLFSILHRFIHLTWRIYIIFSCEGYPDIVKISIRTGHYHNMSYMCNDSEMQQSLPLSHRYIQILSEYSSTPDVTTFQ